MHLHSLEMPAIAFRIPSSALQSHWDVLWNIDNHWRPWQRAMGKKIPSASPSCVMAMIGTNGTRQAEVTVDVAGIRYFSRCSLFFSLLGCVLCVCSQISFVRRFGICSLSNERIRMPVFLDVHDLFFFCFLRERIYNSRIFSAAIVTVLCIVRIVVHDATLHNTRCMRNLSHAIFIAAVHIGHRAKNYIAVAAELAFARAARYRRWE